MYLSEPKSREKYTAGLRSQANSKQAKREVYAGLIDEQVYENASQDNNVESINQNDMQTVTVTNKQFNPSVHTYTVESRSSSQDIRSQSNQASVIQAKLGKLNFRKPALASIG